MSQPRGLGPAGLGFGLSAGRSFCRDLGDGGAGGGFVGDGLAGGERGEQGSDGDVVDGAGVAAGCLVDQGGRVVGEQGVGPAGEGQVVLEVAAGFLQGHAVHVVADGDPLVEGGELAELEPAPQGGLADEQAGEYGGGVHGVVGEHAHGLELVGLEEVGFVDDQHGGAAAFGVLGGEGVGGLGGERGGAVGGPAAEGGDDGVVDAADADGGVGQVNGGMPGLVQAGQRAAD